jgi:hypothetical protein
MKTAVPRTRRPKRWALHFACNDYRNGAAQGFVESIQFGAGRGDFNFGTDYLDDYELSIDGEAVEFEWLKDSFKLGPHICLCEGITEGVGNWCWDGCFVSANVLRQICPWLKAQGWSPEGGSTLLYDWWERIGEDA